MFAYVRLVEGLLIAHAYLAVAYLIGSNIWLKLRGGEDSAPLAMVRIVCACALGFVALGTGAFVLGLVGAFSLPGVAVSLVVLFAVGCAAFRRNPFRAVYWIERRREVADAFDGPGVFIYLVMLVAAFPAVNLANAGTDALAYHWAYAMDFIHAGRFVIDPFLRQAFYTHNDLLIVAMLMMAGGYAFLQFVPWMFAMLTALGIASGVRIALPDGLSSSVAGCAFSLAVVLSPAYVRWSDSGYLDVVLAFFAFASMLALMRAFDGQRGDWRWLAVSAAFGAFLIGSKNSLLPLVLVYAVLLALAARKLHCTPTRTAAVLAILVALAAPWYVRNLILAGDPIPPVINLVVFGHDGLVTRSEAAGIAADLKRAPELAQIPLVPFSAFFHPDSRHFVEYGTSALMLLLYVPALAVFIVTIILHRRLAAPVVIPVVFLTVLIAYWLASSTFLRYALIFYPLLALCCGALAGALWPRSGRRGWIVAAAAVLCMAYTPSALAMGFMNRYVTDGILNPPTYYQDDETFLRLDVAGYSEEEFISATLHHLHLHGRLYEIAPPVNYYFRRDGIQSIGDWVGPASFLRLYRSIDAGRAADHLASLGVDAVWISPAMVYGGLDVPLTRQLIAADYRQISIPGSTSILFVRSAVPERPFDS